MDQKMFCFQCEQTAGCSGCTGKAGVCGKSADTANLQDQLTSALIGLAKATYNNVKTEKTDKLILEGLFTTVTNVSFNDETLKLLIDRVNQEKREIAPGCVSCPSPCANGDQYSMDQIWSADEDIRSLKQMCIRDRSFIIAVAAGVACHLICKWLDGDKQSVTGLWA